MKAQLGVFLKLPVPGQCKTRLAATLGEQKTVTAYRWMLEEVLDHSASSQWERTLFGEPRHPRESYEREFSGERIVLQEGEGLGARLVHAFAHLLKSGPAVILGTDCVDLTRERIAEAFAALSDHDLVLGPALDGGYTLIGLAEPQPLLFDGIPWSTPEVLALTMEKANAFGLKCAALETLPDIDTEEDLKQVRPDWWRKLVGNGFRD